MKNKGYILAAVLLINSVHAINYSVNAICVKETGSFHGRISAHDYESLLRGRARSRRPLPVSLRIARSEDAPTQCDCCVFLNVQQSHHVN